MPLARSKTRKRRGSPETAKLVSMRRPLLYCSHPSPFSTIQMAAGLTPAGRGGKASATGWGVGAGAGGSAGAAAAGREKR